MDGPNQTRSSDETNTLNTNHSNNLFDAQSNLDCTTTNLQEKDSKANQPTERKNSTSVVFPLTGLNISNSTFNNINRYNGLPSAGGRLSNEHVHTPTITSSISLISQTHSDSSMNRISGAEYSLSDYQHKDDNQSNTHPQQQISTNISNSTNTNVVTIHDHCTKNSSSNNDHVLIVNNNIPSHQHETAAQQHNMTFPQQPTLINAVTQSANTILFNTNQSMSNNVISGTDFQNVRGNYGTISNNTGLHANSSIAIVVANSNNSKKNMQNGQGSAFGNQHHVVSSNSAGINSSNMVGITNLNANLHASLNESRGTNVASVIQQQQRMYQNATLSNNNMHQLTIPTLTPQMVNNQGMTGIQHVGTNISNASQPTITCVNTQIPITFQQPYIINNNHQFTTTTTSEPSPQHTMLKLDLEDFLKTLQSAEYQKFIELNQQAIISDINNNSGHAFTSNFPNNQHNPSPNFVNISSLPQTPSTPSIFNNTLFSPQQTQQQPQSNNLVNNNIIQVFPHPLPPPQHPPYATQTTVGANNPHHVGSLNLGRTHVSCVVPPFTSSSQQNTIHSTPQQLQQSILQSSMNAQLQLQFQNNPSTSMLQQSILAVSTPTNAPSTSSLVTPLTINLAPSLVQQSSITSLNTVTNMSQIPPTLKSSTPTSGNTAVGVGSNATESLSKEYVIHENEYDRKKIPKSRKRQSVDYCNQKKMEFKMEISKPSTTVMVTSSSVLTPSSNMQNDEPEEEGENK